MGLIGGTASLVYMSSQRINLTTEETQLRNTARLIESEEQQKQSSIYPPTLSQFQYNYTDANGNQYKPYTVQNGQEVYNPSSDNFFTDSSYQTNQTEGQNNPQTAQNLYNEAMTSYDQQSVQDQNQMTPLAAMDQTIQDKINNIEVQLKTLDAQQQGITSSLQTDIKDSCSTLGNG